MAQVRITFLPMDRVAQAEEGENLLDVAMASDIHINASCGGNGACGKCRVKLIEGDAESPPHPTISQGDYDAGIRLACITTLRGNVTVEIPLESQVDRLALKRLSSPARHVLSPEDMTALVEGVTVDPPVFKRYVDLPEPTQDDNLSDLGRLMRGLRTSHGVNGLAVDFRVLKGLSRLMRAAGWKVTATIGEIEDRKTLINVEEGDRKDRHYSIVIDIGTTTICGQLIDLGDCRTPGCILAESSDYNSQISFGEDVISRIHYSGKKGGLKKLQQAVTGTINRVIREILESAGASRDLVSHMVLAGNTTMSHLALGLDPTPIMLAPYTPTATSFPPVRAASLGLDAGGHVYAYLIPSVSSYVGGDIVAGVLGSGMFQRAETALFMDIGTNGEIVLGNRDWLTCASCSAGPAFEGGGIQCGMRAGRGALEKVRINPTTYEPMILTVGRAKPMGICGSGLIDLAAGLLETGLIDRKGKFARDGRSSRVRAGGNGYEYVVSYAAETGTGRDVVITEIDLDNLIRTKAAIYGGCKVLLQSLGLAMGDIDRVVIAGGFGHSLDLEKAVTIGLLPEMAPEKFTFVGNGSLLGARLTSLSKGFFREAAKIAGMMTNIELSAHPRFMEEFVAAMFLPHTDSRDFPGVTERLKESESKEI